MSARPARGEQELLTLTDVGRTYPGSPPVHALRGATFSVLAGEVLGIIGRSGSRKSTLLNVLGLLDMPTSGDYRVGGQRVGSLSDREQTGLRARFFGFRVPGGVPAAVAERAGERRARVAAASAGAQRAARTRDRGARTGRAVAPAAVSAGQDVGRRVPAVAIARALAQRPRVLLCDEPTGNLDERTSGEVLRTLIGNQAPDVTVVMVTHDLAIARTLPRC